MPDPDVGGYGASSYLQKLTNTKLDSVITALGGAGAANLNNTQVATSGTVGTLAIARPTRTRLLVKNLDGTISVYIGKATVSAANGMELKAGESVEITWVGLVQIIAASGTPNVAIWDEYN